MPPGKADLRVVNHLVVKNRRGEPLFCGPEGAAAKLGIPRSTLDSKIKQLRIKKHRLISE